MFLVNIARHIYRKGTASEDQIVTVKGYSTNKILWRGPAKELKKSDLMKAGWLVVEIRVDKSDKTNPDDWNKARIISVI